MKNILLPTDLSVQSLWPIHNIVKEANNQKVNIRVVHLLNQPTGITDLLWLNSSKPYKQVPASFTEAFQLLKNKYAHAIEKMEFSFVYGSTARFVNNFIAGNNIDAVYMLTNYKYAQPLSNSVNSVLLFQKCKVTMHQLPLHAEALSNYQILSALLDGNEQYTAPAASKSIKSTISFS